MPYSLGVDVGGTFTDLVLTDESGGAIYRAKTPSTPKDQSEGVLEGIEKVCRVAGVKPLEITAIRHSTTVGVNTVLTGSGATVGLVTTTGFRHVLHVARSYTPGPLAGWINMIKPDPPALVELTIEADERIDAKGKVIKPLDEQKLRADLRKLLDRGIQALTISLLNAYANPLHERRVAAIVREMQPKLLLSVSSEVLREFREYERTLTAALNAYIGPAVSNYLDQLSIRLSERQIPSRVSLLRSDGGLMSLDAARDRPVDALVSGPVGGIAGALFVANMAGFKNILTVDVGGTSTDVAVCIDGAPNISRETNVGSFVARIPAIDVRTVGAGGGSIAHVPELTRALRVGPQSAGAEPGPAAYRKGGVEPTVTDANLVLGYLPPSLLGGEMTLDVEAARQAVQKVADGLGLDLYRAAAGIIDMVNENMLGALRLVSVQRGYDPRDFALVAFGGAGPAHANALGVLLGSWPVIIPKGPGLLCALGDLVTNFRNEFGRTFIRTFEQTSMDELKSHLEEMGASARHWLDEQGIPIDAQTIEHQVDVRYYRQGFELPVTVDMQVGNGLEAIGQRFDEMHQRLYGFSLDTAHEVVNLRAIAVGANPQPAIPELRQGTADPDGARVGGQQVYIAGSFRQAYIYDREKLLAGNRIAGPAIITEMDSTTLILPDHTGEVDRFGNILIRPDGR